jgi:hypothetical protein
MARSLEAERQVATTHNASSQARLAVRSKLNSILRLLLIWGSAGIISFALVMTVYTVFFGRDVAEYNETIYENYRLVHVPHSSQLYTQEGYGVTTFGEDGLVVDKEVNFDATRLLFLGDSYMEAKQVSDPQKLTEIVERTWNALHQDQPIQTLNLGAAGEDIRTYLSFGRNMDQRFQPHMVLILLNRQDFVPLSGEPETLAKLEQDPTIKLVRPQRLSPIQRLISPTIFRQFFLRLLFQTNDFLQQGSNENAAAQAEAADESVDILVGREAAVASQLQALKNIWGDRLVIIYNVHIPNFGRGIPDTYEDDTLIREAAKLDIPIVNLYEPMLGAFRSMNLPRGFNNTIYGTGHFNVRGHEVIAGAVLDHLEAGGLQEVLR